MSDNAKKGIVATVAFLLVGYAVYALFSSFGDEVLDAANTRTFMDVNTKKLYQVEIKEGEKFYPKKNPSTGEMTLYPTEVCYKNDCLNAGGTHVILNEILGEKGPTFCPKCGALVVAHNPGPRTEVSDSAVSEILKQVPSKPGD